MEINHIRFLRKLDRFILRLNAAVFGQPLPTLKRLKQVSSSHCGPATLAMLFSFVGQPVSQRRIVGCLRAEAKIKTRGLTVKDLARATRILGKKELVFWKKTGARMADLAAITGRYHYPVGVEWQGVFYEDEDEDSGHYGVVTKVDIKKGYLFIADPYRRFAGVDRKFRIGDFDKRWWDANEITIPGTRRKNLVYDKRMMFVVAPKKATFPKKFGMFKSG